jgi:hypothetical protein
MIDYVKIFVTTDWLAPDTAAGADNIKASWRPAISDDYPLRKCTDVTKQLAGQIPPVPNQTLVRALVTEAVFLQIDADPKYEIVSSDPGINVLMPNGSYE